jgi:hypothetical protein
MCSVSPIWFKALLITRLPNLHSVRHDLSPILPTGATRHESAASKCQNKTTFVEKSYEICRFGPCGLVRADGVRA